MGAWRAGGRRAVAGGEGAREGPRPGRAAVAREAQRVARVRRAVALLVASARSWSATSCRTSSATWSRGECSCCPSWCRSSPGSRSPTPRPGGASPWPWSAPRCPPSSCAELVRYRRRGLVASARGAEPGARHRGSARHLACHRRDSRARSCRRPFPSACCPRCSSPGPGGGGAAGAARRPSGAWPSWRRAAPCPTSTWPPSGAVHTWGAGPISGRRPPSCPPWWWRRTCWGGHCGAPSSTCCGAQLDAPGRLPAGAPASGASSSPR